MQGKEEVTEGRAPSGERLTGASVISAKVKTLAGALFCLGTFNSDNSQIGPGASASPHYPWVSGATGKCPFGSSFLVPSLWALPGQGPSGLSRPAQSLASPFCRSRLKTLMSLSWTPMPVRRGTESVALSLLPRLMEPLA